MPTSLYRLPASDPARPLRLALAPGVGPHVEAVVRAYFPPPHTLQVGWADDVDVVLVWWSEPTAPTGVEPPESVPLVALCTGGPDALAAALDAGADYAFTLPATPALLRAACDAYARARTARREPEGTAPAPALPFDLDLRARTLTVREIPVHLTLREFDLLAYFAERCGACCTREEILEEVWGIDFETGTNTIDVFVYALRRKLQGAGLPGLIQTVRGAGYRFVP